MVIFHSYVSLPEGNHIVRFESVFIGMSIPTRIPNGMDDHKHPWFPCSFEHGTSAKTPETAEGPQSLVNRNAIDHHPNEYPIKSLSL